MKRFSRLLGNEDAKLRLSDAVASGTLPHALLIVGRRGSGKHTLAYEIAAAANCIGNTELSYPCGACRNCKRIYSMSFPDLTLLARSDSKATIGVEELRDFREDMFLSSTESDYKFYIIEDADHMTPAAQNALLKVLEEPPENVHIILLASEADKMLSTIKSRAQQVYTEVFDRESLKQHVLELSDTARALSKISPERFQAILLASDGVIGKALNMLDSGRGEEIDEKRKTVKKFISALPKKAKFSALYEATMSLPTKREELREMLEQIRNALWDLASSKFDQNAVGLFFISPEEMEEYSKAIGIGRLIRIYDTISDAIEDLDKNVVINTLLTDLAVRIKG